MYKTYTANADIRRKMQMNGVTMWEIAHKMGIAEATIFRWFRTELAGSKREQIENAINEIIEWRAENE